MNSIQRVEGNAFHPAGGGRYVSEILAARNLGTHLRTGLSEASHTGIAGCLGQACPRSWSHPCRSVDITEIPFNRFVGMERATEPEGVLSFPADVRYTNHLGTVHAGAMLALAEASSGEYLIREFSGLDFPVLPVVRRVEAKFRNPARGAIHTKLHVATDERDAFVATLRNRGRAPLNVHVDVYDEQGAHVLATTIEWFVARQDRPTRS